MDFEQIQIILRTLSLVALLCAGGAAIVLRVGYYRLAAIATVALVTISTAIEHGIVGALVIGFAFGVLLPMLVWVLGRTVPWLLWQRIRRQFPGEPRTPPGPAIVIRDAYRLIWLSGY